MLWGESIPFGGLHTFSAKCVPNPSRESNSGPSPQVKPLLSIQLQGSGPDQWTQFQGPAALRGIRRFVSNSGESSGQTVPLYHNSQLLRGKNQCRTLEGRSTGHGLDVPLPGSRPGSRGSCGASAWAEMSRRREISSCGMGATKPARVSYYYG